jgi:dTMP kinase
MTRGRFISFEGIDGAGKSSQIQTVHDWLAPRGRPVLRTREPGGTALAESLRALFLHQDMDALTEALLVFAARRDHTQRCILPALARGEHVLCDRYTDATYAYQGAGRGFDRAVLAQLEAWVHEERHPDLTLWFDASPATAAARRAAERGPDRLEREDAAFFERVRAGYAERCSNAPQRIVRIDADAPFDVVAARVVAALAAAAARQGW